MGATKEILIKMSEEEYLEIPGNVRETYLASKNITKQSNDFEENMKDPNFRSYYQEYKKSKERLAEVEFHLRELRRKENTK